MAAAGKKKPKGGLWVKPWMLVMAVALGWLAQHQPAQMDGPDIAIWVVGALTAALVVLAVMSITLPVLRMVSVLVAQARAASAQRQGADES